MSASFRRLEVPVLYTTGSFYEVGCDIGRTFAERIKGYWEASQRIQTIMIPFVETLKGKKYYDSTLAACKSAFPQYITEIEGMADGSGVPFKNLFMLCIEKEVYNVLAPNMEDKSCGCSDILINRPGCKILAHNEDTYHVVDSYAYMVSVRIVENDREIESFTAYCYPGTIPGCTTTFNRHGMIFSIDALYPNYVVENVPPRIFLNRAVIKSKNKEETVDILKSKGIGVAYGFTLNIADVKDPSTMWSIEVGPQAGESKIHVYTLHEETDSSKPCHYIHINSIEHLQDVPEIPNLRSSVARRTRANEMEPPRTKEGAFAILGDTTNQEYPIYRSYRTTDKNATVFTSVADILENKMYFYRENPAKPGQRPLFHLQIKDGSN